MVLHLSGTCVGHRDTPVPTEDTTSLQPSLSRLQVASLREDGRAHTMHLFVFEHIALEVFSVARPNAHLSIWNVPERHAHLSVFRHDDTSSVSKECSFTVPMFGPAPRRTQHHWNRNEVPEEWHNRILMQGDISNACGSINRLQVLEAVRMHILGLAPFLRLTMCERWDHCHARTRRSRQENPVPRQLCDGCLAREHAEQHILQLDILEQDLRAARPNERQNLSKGLHLAWSTMGTDVAELSRRQVPTSILRSHV